MSKRRRPCKKLRHEKRSAAFKQLRELERKDGYVGNVYYCHACRAYHVGSTEGFGEFNKERRKNPSPFVRSGDSVAPADPTPL